MNLDDFIVAENVATPAGLSLTPSPEAARQADEQLMHPVASAIPIKSRKALLQGHIVPQSVPVPQHLQRVPDEFGYVTRHPRKTSIDERRVGDFRVWHDPACICFLVLLRLFLTPSQVHH